MNLTFSDKPRPDQTSSGVALPLNPLTFASTHIAQKLAVQQLQTDAEFLPVSAPHTPSAERLQAVLQLKNFPDRKSRFSVLGTGVSLTLTHGLVGCSSGFSAGAS